MDQFPALTIGEIAHRSGVAASAIRYYESLGLLPPPPRVHGERRYTHDILGALAFITVAQAAGFTLREIEQLCGQSTPGLGLSAAIRTLSEQKLVEVNEAIVRAAAMKEWLEAARDCGCSASEDCSLFPSVDELPGAGRVPEALPRIDDGCRRVAL